MSKYKVYAVFADNCWRQRLDDGVPVESDTLEGAIEQARRLFGTGAFAYEPLVVSAERYGLELFRIGPWKTERLREGCQFGDDYTGEPESYLCHRIECEAAGEIERLRAERRWISVEDRSPETGVMGESVAVLVCLPRGEIGLGFYSRDEFGARWSCQSTRGPTHWMPLPLPPENQP